MNCTATYIPYNDTARFSKLVLDYINANPLLLPYFSYTPDVAGIKEAMLYKSANFKNRDLLVTQLEKQYAAVPVHPSVNDHLQQLKNVNTFTICTAHQPNIFTGPLYFIYKILHTVKLAAHCNALFPDNYFVPVYYMGSEDADLDELGHIYSGGKKYAWETNQTGAVGRMLVDKKLLALIDGLSAQLSVEEFGDEIISQLRAAYIIGDTIEQATFRLVNALFGKYGLIVLLPDNAVLKSAFIPIIEKELTEQFSAKEVAATITSFPEQYNVQTTGRELNVFYLEKDKRERIEINDGRFTIANTELNFSKVALLDLLKKEPKKFSPNVILRPVYQECILPNVAFIGGGGELAYWLELKNVFKVANIAMPILVLRNSYLWVNKKNAGLLTKLSLKPEQLFEKGGIVLKELINKNSAHTLSLSEQFQQLNLIYQTISSLVKQIDPTLQPHVAALQKKANDKLLQLEKKMYRAERKHFEAMERQFNKAYQSLFPMGNLQERTDNLLAYYAVYGMGFIDAVFNNALSLEQQFTILSEA